MLADNASSWRLAQTHLPCKRKVLPQLFADDQEGVNAQGQCCDEGKNAILETKSLILPCDNNQEGTFTQIYTSHSTPLSQSLESKDEFELDDKKVMTHLKETEGLGGHTYNLQVCSVESILFVPLLLLCQKMQLRQILSQRGDRPFVYKYKNRSRM